jgi:hypothetical protein
MIISDSDQKEQISPPTSSMLKVGRDRFQQLTFHYKPSRQRDLERPGRRWRDERRTEINKNRF